jgi:hypothetical protein
MIERKRETCYLSDVYTFTGETDRMRVAHLDCYTRESTLTWTRRSPTDVYIRVSKVREKLRLAPVVCSYEIR